MLRKIKVERINKIPTVVGTNRENIFSEVERINKIPTVVGQYYNTSKIMVERINKVPAVAGRKPVLNFRYVKTTLKHIIRKEIGLFGKINKI